MIINNSLSEIGDKLIIKSQSVIDGDVNITSFNDITEGETVNRFFIKKFKYSKDGINYSKWIDLTNENLQTINGKIPGLLFFEFLYERGGNDNTGVITFKELKINGNIVLNVFQGQTTLDSIFSEFVENDYYTLAVRNNLLKKIYYHGILPKFIERGEGIPDDDFISIWSAIAIFLTFANSFMENFDKIFFKRDLLEIYLKQQGLNFCKKNTLFTDLQYLTSNLYNEIRRRGTNLIYKRKGDILQSEKVLEIDGELLRVICNKKTDEFLFELINKEQSGYCLGKSSPLYNGTYFSKQLNKTPENSEDFYDINNWKHWGTIQIQDIDNKRAIKLDLTNGIGDNSGNRIVYDEDLIVIDPTIDYEITFDVLRKSGDGIMKFSVLGFNKDNVLQDKSFANINNGSENNVFYELKTSDLCKIEDVWYSVRGIIYAKYSKNLFSSNKHLMNIGYGNNLKFSINTPKKLQIQLQSESEIFIHNLKMRPLIRGKNILPLTKYNPSQTRIHNKKIGEPFVKNPQFIQSNNQILNWRKNNSEMSIKELDNLIIDYLIPYQLKYNSIELQLLLNK